MDVGVGVKWREQSFLTRARLVRTHQPLKKLPNLEDELERRNDFSEPLACVCALWLQPDHSARHGDSFERRETAPHSETVSLRGSSPIRVMGKLIAVDELPLGLAQLSLRAHIPGAVTCAVVSVALAVPAPACIAVAQRRWRWGCLWRGGLPGRFLLPRTLPIRCPATAGGWTDLDRLDSDRRPAPCPCIWNLRRGARDGERDSKSDK